MRKTFLLILISSLIFLISCGTKNIENEKTLISKEYTNATTNIKSKEFIKIKKVASAQDKEEKIKEMNKKVEQKVLEILEEKNKESSTNSNINTEKISNERVIYLLADGKITNRQTFFNRLNNNNEAEKIVYDYMQNLTLNDEVDKITKLLGNTYMEGINEYYGTKTMDYVFDEKYQVIKNENINNKDLIRNVAEKKVSYAASITLDENEEKILSIDFFYLLDEEQMVILSQFFDWENGGKGDKVFKQTILSI